MLTNALGRRLRRCALWTLWGVSVLLLLEGVTRAFFGFSGQDIEIWRNFTPTRTARVTISDPVLGWRLLPSVARNVHTSEFQLVYRTNSHGLRERELRDDGRLRVLFLGDSQTFGEGVEIGQRFSDLVGRELQLDTVNAGVPGWGVHQMVDWFTLEGFRLRPDLVVCAPIEGDFERALHPVGGSGPPHVIRSPDEHEFVPPRYRAFVARWDERLRVSYLYAFASARFKIALLARRLEQRDRHVWDTLYRQAQGVEGDAPVPAAARPEGAEGGAPVTGQAFDEQLDSPRARRLRARSAELLARLRESARAARAELLLASIDDHPLPWLENLARRQGVAYLDASPALRGQVGVRHRIDPHYTAKGHALLAQALVAGLAPLAAAGRRSPGPDEAGRLWLEREAQRLRAGTTWRELPSDGFRAAWEALDVPTQLASSERRVARVRVTNVGSTRWTPGGDRYCPVRLGHRWLVAGAGEWKAHAVELPGVVRPGASVELSDTLEAPVAAGQYQVEFDLACTGRTWFGPRGSATLRVPVRVQ